MGEPRVPPAGQHQTEASQRFEFFASGSTISSPYATRVSLGKLKPRLASRQPPLRL
jgi:hypothetical protein